MPTFPTLKVEIAFASDPLDDTPTYVDVTAYVRLRDGVMTRRGGNGDPDQPDQAGFARFVLANRDRRFDWTHSSGPYFGQLTPRRQVRISGTWDSVDYPIFKGWTTGFRCEGRAKGQDAVCVVEAYDALGVLAGKRLAGDPLADYVEALPGSTSWFRNVDPAGWIDEGDQIRYAVPAASQTLLPGTSLLPTLKSNAFVGDSTRYCRIGPQDRLTSGASLTQPWTIGWWIQTPSVVDPVEESVAPVLSRFTDAVNYWDVGIRAEPDPGPGFVNVHLSVTGAYTDVLGSVIVDDGVPHFIVATCTGSVVKLYVDGVLDEGAVTVLSGGGHFNIQADFLGGLGLNASSVVQPLRNGALQDVLLNTTALTAAQVSALYDLSRGIAVETTTARAGRILDEADWPSAWRDISASTVGICGPIAFNGQSVLTGLQEVETTEQGRMYATRDGKLAFRQRYYAYQDTLSKTVQLTFSDDGSDQKYSTFGHRRGDEDVVNDATVSNGQVQARSTNATSITTYDTNANTYNTALSTYQQALDMARGIVFLRKDAKLRLDPIQVPITTSWPTLLQLELATRVRVESTPMGVGSQMVADVLVESVGWNIDEKWDYILSGMPVPPDPVDEGFWVLGTSELDSGTVPAY